MGVIKMPGDVYLSLIRKMMNMEKQGNSTPSQRRYIAAPSSAESDKLRLTSLTSSAETYLSLVDLSPDKFQFKALSRGVGIMGDCKKKPEDCLKKSNILVYQQPTGQKQERKPQDCKGKIKIPICSPQPKQIKICTGKDLRKMCAPPVCPPCPPPAAHKGLLRILGFGLKSAIAAAVVYVTYDMGVWGSPDDTQQLYSNACTMVGKPLPKKNDKWDPPSCEAESEFFTHPPHNPYSYCGDPPIRTEDTYMKLKHLWNNGVTYVFHGLANLPNMFTKTEPIQEEVKKEPPCVPYSELSEEEKATLSNNVYKQ